MAIKQKEVTVNGTTYLLTQFPSLRGVRIMKRLVKTLGPSFAELQAGGNLSTALNVLFDNLTDDVELLIPELVSSATIGGVGLNFDMEFAGEYDKLLLLAKEVVIFNFGSVFTLIGSDVS